MEVSSLGVWLEGVIMELAGTASPVEALRFFVELSSVVNGGGGE